VRSKGCCSAVLSRAAAAAAALTLLVNCVLDRGHHSAEAALGAVPPQQRLGNISTPQQVAWGASRVHGEFVALAAVADTAANIQVLPARLCCTTLSGASYLAIMHWPSLHALLYGTCFGQTATVADLVGCSTTAKTQTIVVVRQQHICPWCLGLTGLQYNMQHGVSERSPDVGPCDYCVQVSAVIRGSPTEVLRALMDPHSATTILGPALEVEVLDSSPGRQVRGGKACVLAEQAGSRHSAKGRPQ
jgi:hypothetical protein